MRPPSQPPGAKYKYEEVSQETQLGKENRQHKFEDLINKWER
jgi:hypothetical protein